MATTYAKANERGKIVAIKDEEYVKKSIKNITVIKNPPKANDFQYIPYSFFDSRKRKNASLTARKIIKIILKKPS